MLDLILKLNPFALGIVGIILLILFINIIASFKIKSKYKILISDIEDIENQENKIFEYELFNSIVKDYKKAQNRNIEEINTIAIIEKHVHINLKRTLLGERFLKKSVSLMIILGLVGTFYGLTLSIGELVNLLTSTGEAIVGDVNAITDGLILAVRSMSVAFVTSLFGITSSIIVTLVNVMFNITDYRERLIVSVEEYLDNQLARKGKPLEFINEDGKTNLETAFDTFGNIIEVNLKEVTSELSYRLTNSSTKMAESAEIIKNSIDKFDLSLDKFNDNVRDFSEFNHHLKTNIERMSISFDDLTNSLKEQNNYKDIIQLKNSINKLIEKVD
jgi:hypothetical protein